MKLKTRYWIEHHEEPTILYITYTNDDNEIAHYYGNSSGYNECSIINLGYCKSDKMRLINKKEAKSLFPNAFTKI